ncbi:MAG: rRNA maturation RNase YbeY [Bacillota bacterium]|nr:rRNA maturation RNase YbeY [Bacillota bacterium]MDW7678405.1 rRNA maturation RNase YbeY [Bacillota bacterium]
MNIVVDIDHRQDLFVLSQAQEALIRKAIETCYELEGLPEDYEVSLSFVMNAEIQELNRVYRGKNEPTDVLSFPMEGPSDAPEKLLGDIVISVEKMAEQAEEYGHGINREMVYLVVHSVLHLMGYDHLDDMAKAVMRRKEEAVLEQLALSR